MIFRKLLSFLLVLVIVFSLGCERAEENTDFKIVASFYPVYIFTLNLLEGIEDVSLSNMTDGANACLHDYQLTSGDMKLLSNSDLIIINGAGMEGFIEKAISSNEALNVVDSSKGIDLIEGECHNHNHEHDESHDHGTLSHIWLSVPNAILQVENIYNALSQALPEKADVLKTNKDNYIKSLEELHAYLQSETKKLTKPIVTFHSAYEYFSQEYGLPVLASIETDTGAEPSARQLGELTRLMLEKEVTAIFIEPDYAGTAANILANETGAKLYVLNPLTGGENTKTAYEDLMRENMQVLLEAQG